MVVAETPFRGCCGDELGVLAWAGKPFFVGCGKGAGVLARGGGYAKLGRGGGGLCISPLVTLAELLAPIETCSVGETDPAVDGRVSQVEAGRSGFLNLDEGAEPSIIVGIPPSSFDGGRVVNTWRAGGEGRSCPWAGVNEGRPFTAKPERRGSSGGAEPGLFWGGGVPEGSPPGVKAATRAICGGGERLTRPGTLAVVAGGDELVPPRIPDNGASWLGPPEVVSPFCPHHKAELASGESLGLRESVVLCTKERECGTCTVCVEPRAVEDEADLASCEARGAVAGVDDARSVVDTGAGTVDATDDDTDGPSPSNCQFFLLFERRRLFEALPEDDVRWLGFAEAVWWPVRCGLGYMRCELMRFCQRRQLP